jgi:hypothetical protein
VKVGDLVKFTVGAAAVVNVGVIVTVPEGWGCQADILWGDKIIQRPVNAIEVINGIS